MKSILLPWQRNIREQNQYISALKQNIDVLQIDINSFKTNNEALLKAIREGEELNKKLLDSNNQLESNRRELITKYETEIEKLCQENQYLRNDHTGWRNSCSRLEKEKKDEVDIFPCVLSLMMSKDINKHRSELIMHHINHTKLLEEKNKSLTLELALTKSKLMMNSNNRKALQKVINRTKSKRKALKLKNKK